MRKADLFNNIKNIIKELGHLTPMALVMVFLPMAGSIVLMLFLSPIGEWFRANWELGTIVYLISTALLCGLSLVPTNVIGLVGGWAFGFWLGLGLLTAAIFVASTMSFFIHSRISGRKLPDFASKRIKIDAVYRTLMREDYWRTTLIIFLLRISVIMPFAFSNFLLASARVPLGSYILGTFAGMLPRSAAMVLAGAGLAQLDPQSSRDIITLFMGIAATIFSIVVIARLSRNALASITEREPEVEIVPMAQA